MGLRNAGFHLVETLSVMVPVASGFGATIDPESLCPAPATASLRVRTEAAEVHWMGRSVVLSHQLFPVFQRLLEKALSRDQAASSAHVEGSTGREAKDLIRELRAALVAAGFTKAEAETLIVTVRGRGYRLGIPANSIMVDGW
jgi:DNA-binding response OmpR family regulator